MINFLRKSRPKNTFPIETDSLSKEKIIFDEKHVLTTENLKYEVLDRIKKTEPVFDFYTNINKTFSAMKMFENGFSFDMMTIRSGFIGREHFKTISMSSEKPSIIQVLFGNGYVIIENGENIKIVRVAKNSFVYIPKGYSFVVVNSSNDSYLSFMIARSSKYPLLSGSLKHNRGASLYYLKSGFKKNMNSEGKYKLEEYEKDYLPNLEIAHDVDLYEQICENPEKFEFISRF